MKKTKTPPLIGEQLGLKKASTKVLNLMMHLMVIQCSVVLYRISRCIGWALPESTQRRFSRFLGAQAICPKAYARYICQHFKLKRRSQVELSIDRTNWKRGKIDFNFLVVALKIGKSAIPLFVIPLVGQRSGNTSIEQFKTVIQWIKETLKCKIRFICGDREFGVIAKILIAQAFELPFVFRIKQQWHYEFIEADGTSRLLHKRFKQLKPLEEATLHGIHMGLQTNVFVSVSAKRLMTGELLMVVHAPEVDNPLEAYKKRWAIERLFLNCKTNGFYLEATGLKDANKIQQLILIIGLVLALAIQQAIHSIKYRPLKLKKHRYHSESLFSRGLASLIPCFLQNLSLSLFLVR